MDAAADVTRVAGIGRTFASHLRARGIVTVGDLRTRLATADLRRVLAWETGISERKLETWFRLSQGDPAPARTLSVPDPAPAPEPVRIAPNDGLSGAESNEIAADPLDVAEPAPLPAEPFDAVPERAAPVVLDPIVDDAARESAPAALPDPAMSFAPIDTAPILRSVGRLRTFSLAVLALALVALASAISMSVSRGERPAGPDPLLSAGASSVAHLERANTLFREGRADEAEGEYRLALALDPGSVEARVQLGRSLHRQRKFAEAVAELRAAIELRDDVAAAHYYLSGALLGQKDAPGALAAARRAAALDPAFPWSYYNIALAWDAIDDAPRLAAVEHRSAVRALLLDLETAQGDGFAQTVRLLERLTGRAESPGAEAMPGASETVRDAWRHWGEREGLLASASPQPGDAVGDGR